MRAQQALAALLLAGSAAAVGMLPAAADQPVRQRPAQTIGAPVGRSPVAPEPAWAEPLARPGIFGSPSARATSNIPNIRTASKPVWSIEDTAPQPNGYLLSDSCAGPTACTAVGYYESSSGFYVTLAETWNGTKWKVEATPNPSGSIGSLLGGVSCSSADACSAVGDYENSSEVTMTLAETWNGTDWSIDTTPNPSGSEGTLLDGVSCTGADVCTAVGYYQKTSGENLIDVTLAETWNGTDWSIQTTPNPKDGGQLFSVSCVVSSCTAVGEYVSSSRGADVSFAEGWNGTLWSIETTPNPGNKYDAIDLDAVSCTSASTCTAVGSYASTFGNEPFGTFAEGWNGTAWTIQKTPNARETDLDAVSCTSASACTAVGISTADASGASMTLGEAWNGKTWTIQKTPDPTSSTQFSLYGVSCTSASACIDVGVSVAKSSGAYVTLAQAWNGATWKAQTAADPPGGTPSSLSAMSCSAANACTAIGVAAPNSTTSLSLVERWNGTAWDIEKTPDPTNTELEAVSCSGASACTAVGAQSISDTLAEAWNGTAWDIQTTPDPSGALFSWLSAVSCLNASACTAVGGYESSSGTVRNLAETWNGTSWSIETTPDPTGTTGSQLTGVSCTSASACTAVGSYGDSSGVLVTLAETWNGTAWSIDKTPNPSGATSSSFSSVSCTSASACTAVGSSDGEKTLAERWNGSAWTIQTTPNASDATESVLLSVSCSGADACTAVGNYLNSSDLNLTLAETWNGTSWSIQSTSNPKGTTGSYLNSVWCSDASSCTAVGSYENSIDAELTLAETENG